MPLRCLARGDHNCPTACHNGRAIVSPDARRIIKVSTGVYSEPARVLIHPSFESGVDGRGYYKYPVRPTTTRGFGRHALRKKDVLLERTGAGHTTIENVQRWEDCMIQETWTADSKSTWVLTEMYRVLHEYYVTVPDPGDYVGWCPFDLSWNRYFVQIVDVSLGGGATDHYHDVLVDLRTFQDSYQQNELTLTLKLVRRACPPTGEISFTGA